jgi:hypothetical protein
MERPLFAVIGRRLSRREMEIITPAIALALCDLKLQSIRWLEPSQFGEEKFGLHLELVYEENVRDPVVTLTLKTEDTGLTVSYADKARYVPLALRNLTVKIPTEVEYLFWGKFDDQSCTLYDVLVAWFYMTDWPAVRKSIARELDALVLEGDKVTNFKFGDLVAVKDNCSINLTIGTVSEGRCYLTTFTRDRENEFAFVIASIDSDTRESAKLEIVASLLKMEITLPYHVHLG